MYQACSVSRDLPTVWRAGSSSQLLLESESSCSDPDPPGAAVEQLHDSFLLSCFPLSASLPTAVGKKEVVDMSGLSLVESSVPTVLSRVQMWICVTQPRQENFPH